MTVDKSASDRGASEALVPRSRVTDLGPPTSPVRTLFSARSKTKSGEPTLSQVISVSTNLETKPRITRPYEEDGWIHACAKAKAQALSQAPLEIWIGDPRTDKNARLLPPGDVLNRVLDRPNPLQTRLQFIEASFHHRVFDGEDFWFLLDKDGAPVTPTAGLQTPVPATIFPVRGDAVTMVRDPKNGLPREWRTKLYGAAGQLVAGHGSIVHFRDYDIDNPLRGLGDVEALISDIDLAWQATRYQRAVLKNSGDPGGFITTEVQLAPDEAEATENDASTKFGVQNAGRWKVLTGKGVTYTPNKLGPRDMDFAKLHPWIRDKICAVLGVPPPYIGVLDNAHLNNFVECVRMFWQGGNGVLSYLATVEDVFTNVFLRRLQHPQALRLFGRFNTKGVKALQEDKALQLEIAKKLARELPISIEESCHLVGIEVEEGALKYGGVHFMDEGRTTPDRVLENAANPPEEDPDAEPEPADDGDDDGGDDDGKSAAAASGEPGDERPLTRESDSPPAPPAEDTAATAAADRAAYWEAKEAQLLIPGEAALRKKYRAWRKNYERAQFKRIRDFAADGLAGLRGIDAKAANDDGPPPTSISGGIAPHELDPLLLDQQSWGAKGVTGLRPSAHQIIVSAINNLAEELSDEFPLTGSDQAVLDALERQMIRLFEGHTSYLAERVRAALVEGLSKATSTGTLQQMVEEVLPEIEGALTNTFSDKSQRAALIARDQAANAANMGRYLEMKHAGVEEHEWVTQRNPAVRGTPGGPYEDAQYSHHELDGKSVAVGSFFDPEKHPGLKVPKDPDGEPGDVINCRCFTRPVLKKKSEDQS